ncbi:class 3 adenylate cyclase [Rhizobium binae]|uniref:Class 3 adenylate cyclase n=1 Tax=Rhizobium binae TaxID=1138190 RepID=A0ABV2MA93_9HYPH|nr:adenylate/guanylate cyclase domain-containing protein [Rhizobium binae]NKL52847.1 adenylate/guanylate cyclase domain-containing protein [Rhizobium leguminosarum bv. viciae]MBX4929033.1 adenylate/guanylate cyclase domain-containing protein [Rhizobium binae]MBX4953564.1 adenylate/guanylate cyclase domain-containing protein [Rhizobium binae]MBX4966013.1 adenylate/guanylate cyclase domain-containing protein [Rhizobium binae]MBX4992256.1 adenylate/guanylate cyclase domain-containing protein [Rhi
MSDVQERLLDNKMTEMELARSWSPRVISKFESLIRSGDDFSLYRINPLAFARDHAISEAESIDLFLHATRSGLFEMSWDVVCPQSGMVLDSFGALRTLKTHYVCGLCDVSGETDLDDFIEVTFTVSPQLRRLPFHDPASLSVEDFHWKARFLSDARLPGQQARFLDVLKGMVRGLTFLAPGSVTTMRTELGPGALAGINVQSQASFAVPVAGAPAVAPTLLRVRYDGQRFSASLPAVQPGPVIVEIENSAALRGSLLLINWPPEILAQTAKPVLDFDPYMSGGMLLARQTFRRLFRSERVDEREGLGIRQVTLLFTDLKGSTAMYERLGDLNAYALVREHFALLEDTVQAHAGAIVKTIGDAVMAAFSRPTDAVSAALHMLGEIERFNSEHGDPSIILKIGAHCGPSIAVTLNDNLDYFGQTVNVAARVQSLADAGEICISEALFSAPDVGGLLSGHRLAAFEAPLRGVEGTACVYRVTPGQM